MWYFSHKRTMNLIYSSKCSKPGKNLIGSFQRASEEAMWWHPSPPSIQLTLLFSIFVLFPLSSPFSSGFQRSYVLFCLHILAALHRMWDLSSLTRDLTYVPLQWKQGVLTIRPLAKSCPEIVDSTTNSAWTLFWLVF